MMIIFNIEDFSEFDKFKVEITKLLDAQAWIEATYTTRIERSQRRQVLAFAWPLKRIKHAKTFGRYFDSLWKQFVNGDLEGVVAM